MADLTLGDTALIVAEAKARGVLRNQLAYILATAKWETAHTMKPVRETLAGSDAEVIRRLDRAWARGQLPWVKEDYWSSGFFGRGYVQLTHKANYQRAQDELGKPFVRQPGLALEPDLAAKILVFGMIEGWFTGKALGHYVTLKTSDFWNARRVVNGTDKAAEIAAIADDYDRTLKAAGYGEDGGNVTNRGAQGPDFIDVNPSKRDKGGFVAALAALFAKLFGGRK